MRIVVVDVVLVWLERCLTAPLLATTSYLHILHTYMSYTSLLSYLTTSCCPPKGSNYKLPQPAAGKMPVSAVALLIGACC